VSTKEAPLLELRNISRLYSVGDTGELALNDVSLKVWPGEFLAIVGPSGAGKSTLLNILGLLETTTSGQYLVAGQDVATLSEHDLDEFRSTAFGFVFQSSHMLPYTTVQRNVALGLAALGTPWVERGAIAFHALEQVGMSHRLHADARTLSGGEKQRAAIARALATRPRVVLADEPTGNLDSKNSTAVIEILKELNALGTTVILITHDAALAANADRVLTLKDGQVESDESARTRRPRASTLATPVERKPKRPIASLVTFWEHVCEAANSLAQRPGRTAALLAAFVLGAGGLVVATGLSASAAQQVTARLVEGSLDELYIFQDAGSSSEQTVESTKRILDLPHVDSVSRRVDVELGAAGVSLLAPNTVPGQPSFSGPTVGVDTVFLEQMGVSTAPEHAASLFDSPAGESVALVGKDAAAMLGISEPGPGVRVWVLGRPYEVVGLIVDTERNESLFRSIVISQAALQSSPAVLVVRTEMGYPAAVAEAVPLALAPDNPGSVGVSTVGDLRQLRYGVASDLGSLVAAMSIVLLLLAVLSASSAMLVSVQSRTAEIALRRALGFSRSRTILVFVLEGSALGFAGGLAGVAVGLAAVVLIAGLQGWSAVLPGAAIGVGILAGLFAGVASSILPARQAARVRPAQAIR